MAGLEGQAPGPFPSGTVSPLSFHLVLANSYPSVCASRGKKGFQVFSGPVKAAVLCSYKCSDEHCFGLVSGAVLQAGKLWYYMFGERQQNGVHEVSPGS